MENDNENNVVEVTRENSAHNNVTALGIDENICGLLSYLLGFITGIAFLFIEKENKFVRFHAMQSTITFFTITILLFVVNMVLGMIPILGWLASILLSMIFPFIMIGLVIFLMIKAYKNEMFKLPVIGDIAYKQIYK